MIVKMIFGSYLYGTNTPISDTDYKGVDYPTFEQIALGQIPKNIYYHSTGSDKTKNTKNDIDIEIYSLHEFIKLALQGQTGIFDMLHAPSDMLIQSSTTWEYIISNREKFYSKNAHAFIGYAMGQASKYGLKGSRLDAAKSVLDWMDKQSAKARIEDCDLSTFPKSDHIKFIDSEKDNEKMIDVCGKKLTFKSKIEYNRSIVELFYNQYGQRAFLASQNKAIDWKAISHAFRAAYQIKELFTLHTITFPRPEADFLIKIKLGEFEYKDIAMQLDSLIEEVKDLSTKTTLPEKPDTEFWNNFIIEEVKKLK